MTTLASYQNGNTQVQLYDDGTKIRRVNGAHAVFDFPESLDVKITDYCDAGCAYCHENSTVRGKHADVNALLEVIDQLPAGVELAIGGGNPLDHPDILSTLSYWKASGKICNLTVNQKHLRSAVLDDVLKRKLCYGLGISVNQGLLGDLTEFVKHPNAVIHLIAGVHRPDTLPMLFSMGFRKFLILGYKTWGRGVFYNIEGRASAGLMTWYRDIANFITMPGIVMSFDNLAIQQLQVRRLFTIEGWDQFYMGDDFSHSMYIDAVKKEFAATSRSPERVSWSQQGILEFFRGGQHGNSLRNF